MRGGRARWEWAEGNDATLRTLVGSQLRWKLQRISKRRFPGWENMWWKKRNLLPAEGEQNGAFSPDFTQPGKSLLKIPCTRCNSEARSDHEEILGSERKAAGDRQMRCCSPKRICIRDGDVDVDDDQVHLPLTLGRRSEPLPSLLPRASVGRWSCCRT